MPPGQFIKGIRQAMKKEGIRLRARLAISRQLVELMGEHHIPGAVGPVGGSIPQARRAGHPQLIQRNRGDDPTARRQGPNEEYGLKC